MRPNCTIRVLFKVLLLAWISGKEVGGNRKNNLGSYLLLDGFFILVLYLNNDASLAKNIWIPYKGF